MKRFILLLIFLLGAINAFSQVKIDDYYSEYFEKTYNISASNDEQLVLLIQMSGESKSTDVEIYIKDSRTIESFISSLTQLRSKYAEWRQVAIDNNVTDFSKDFDIAFPSVTVAWYGSKWFFDFGERFKPYFKVTESGEYLTVFHSEAVSATNEYIKEKYYWVFTSVEEFDDLISKIQPAEIIKKLNKKEAPSELFK